MGATTRPTQSFFKQLYRESKRNGEIGDAYSLHFLSQMSMGALNTVMINRVHNADCPAQKCLGALRDYLQSVISLCR